MFWNSPPLTPRNGHTLIVGIVARISGCATQKEASLEDQIDHGKDVVNDLYEGEVNYRIVSTKGKGEQLDRPELVEIEAMLRSRELDLLVVEDLGRLVRGTEAVRLCGIAVDHGVRVIAPNDCIDTIEDTWEEDVISACRDHVGHNAHTSKRLKKKLMNRFRKYGGAASNPIFGYFRPDNARTYFDWSKDESVTRYIDEGLRILKQTLNCSAVADYFNDNNVPVGPYCRRNDWNGAMVRRFYGNPLLKGMPRRGDRYTNKHNESGRRVSVKNPHGPVLIEVPNLAFIDPLEFDAINASLDKKNQNRGRKPVNGIDPRFQVPRKRTRFPGQHACCWYCGRQYVWGANGIKNKLMCNGAREWRCWNSFGFDGALAAERLKGIIFEELYRLDGFDEQFRELVAAALTNSGGREAEERKQLERDERQLARERENVLSSIREIGPRAMLGEEVTRIESRERDLAMRRNLIELAARRQVELPQSIDELHQILEQQFERLVRDSFEFGDLMRQLVPDFQVYLVRLCDGGHPLPRARVTIDLAGSIADSALAPGLKDHLSRVVTLDLFENPPQRERIRLEAVQLSSENLTQAAIASRIPERPTSTAVQKALALDRRMKSLGLQSPYELLVDPPEDYAKLKRHKNPKYRFEPVEGYTRHPL